MANPVYANDLTTIALGGINFDAGTWGESTDGVVEYVTEADLVDVTDT